MFLLVASIVCLLVVWLDFGLRVVFTCLVLLLLLVCVCACLLRFVCLTYC